MSLFENIFKIFSKSPLYNRYIEEFIKKLSIVFCFRVIAAILNVLAIIFATRFLGIQSMGEITLIQNTAGMLVIPATMGLNYAIIKYFPTEKTLEEKKNFLGVLFFWNCLSVVFFAILFLIFKDVFVTILKISLKMWILSIFMMFTTNLSIIADSILRTEKMFFALGSLKLIATLIFFAFMIISCIYTGEYFFFIVFFILHQLLFVVLAFRKLNIKIIRLEYMRFNKSFFRKIYSYGMINMFIQILSFIIFSTDLMIINLFCSPYEVGLYAIYKVAIRNFFNIIFHEVFAVVFLPTIVKVDKAKLYNSIIKFIPLIFLVMTVANGVLGISMVFLYGELPNIKWMYIFLVSVGIGLHFIYWLFNSIYMVEGKKGALMCLKILGIPMPVLLTISVLGTKVFGLIGMMSATIFNHIVLVGVFMAVVYYNNKKLLEKIKK